MEINHRNEQRVMLSDSVARFVKRETNLTRVRKLRGIKPGFERETWKKMADLGWLGVLVPAQYGGMELGFSEMAIIAEGIGGSLIPEPLIGAVVLGAGSLVYGENEILKEQLLPQIIAGEMIPGLAWQEHAGSLDPMAIATNAVEASDGVVITGTKRFAYPAAGTDGFVVSATSPGGLALYWIPRDASGLECSLEPRADGTFSGLLRLSQVHVPKENMVASPSVAENVLQRVVDEATVMTAAEMLGVMKQALEITLDYMRTRVQFGKAIGTFQALRHRAVNLYMQNELSDSALHAAIEVLESSVDAEARSSAASSAKFRCSEAGLRITSDAIHIHGGIGFTDACDIGLYLKRALVLSAWLGNGAEHLRRYAMLVRMDQDVSADETSRTNRNGGAVTGPAGVSASMAGAGDNDWDVMDDDEFRMEVRAFYEQNYPPEIRHPPRRLRWNEIKVWYGQLVKKGWAAPNWPKEFGGMGLSPRKQLIMVEEQERWGVARSPDQGIVMIGPLLIKSGTESQRQTYLPPSLAGDYLWCQGFSEPEAGSDLASLRTEAVLDGNEFVINGQKIWTTLAQEATHMYLLARTDKTVKKQDGISFLLLDLRSPGVTIRPILTIDGREEFCEVFLDDVRTSRENLVGKLNEGWTLAKQLMGFERIFWGSPKTCQYALQWLVPLARERGLFDDPSFVDKLTHLRLDVAHLASAYATVAEVVKQGGTLGPQISYLKIWATETFQRLTELIVQAGGGCGCLTGEVGLGMGDKRIDLLTTYYNARPVAFFAGSNEIQRDILAKRVLNLPS